MQRTYVRSVVEHALSTASESWLVRWRQLMTYQADHQQQHQQVLATMCSVAGDDVNGSLDSACCATYCMPRLLTHSPN